MRNVKKAVKGTGNSECKDFTYSPWLQTHSCIQIKYIPLCISPYMGQILHTVDNKLQKKSQT